MRTTVTLKPYVLAGLKQMAQKEKKTLGEIIEKLYSLDKASGADRFERSELSGFPVLPKRPGVVVTPEDIERIQEELDREEAEKILGQVKRKAS